MNPFISHPSVRIKGTENNYDPATCIDVRCQKSWPHMHCPFCVKTEVFQDPVILKAHYRVKHVDKGIEFAGLKILRCCEHCDIVGTIKGAKEFKGAHWHCYKCRNGFTRRDEAIKHYRTHFRNPSTTFQIQVAKDINVAEKDSQESDLCSVNQGIALDMETVVTTATIDNIISVQPESPLEATQAESPDMGRSHSGEILVSVAANETVGTCDGQTIMIIQDGTQVQEGEVVGTLESVHTNLPGATIRSVQNAPEPKTPEVPRVTGHWRQEKSILELQIKKIKLENSNLIAERHHIQEQLGAEIDNLRVQLQEANQEILTYQKRETELLTQLKIPLDDRISDILTDLKSQHEELLHHQLAQLRRAYIHQLQDELSTTQKSPNSGSQLISAKDVNMAIVRSETGEHISSVMATVSGTNNVVLTTSEDYATLPAGNIVLTSEALIGDGTQNAPLFVMSQSTLQEIKTEGHDGMESEQTAIIDHDLLETADPETSLVQYTHTDQEEVVLSAGGNLGGKILLETSVVSNNISTHVDTLSDSLAPICNNEVLETEALSTPGKRKLYSDSGDQHNYTAKQQKVD